MGTRAWVRYTAQERFEYEMEIRKLRICISICTLLALGVGYFLGHVC